MTAWLKSFWTRPTDGVHIIPTFAENDTIRATVHKFVGMSKIREFVLLVNSDSSRNKTDSMAQRTHLWEARTREMQMIRQERRTEPKRQMGLKHW